MPSPKKKSTKKKAAKTDGKKKSTPARKVSETFEDEVGGGKTQGRLIAREKDETLEALAEKVDDLQSKRQKALALETEAREELTEYMTKHEIEKYDLPGEREVVLRTGDPKAMVHKIVPKKKQSAE